MTFGTPSKTWKPPTLAKKVTSYFDTGIRNRGSSYFWQGRVRILRSSDSEIEARVQGSQSYEVCLRWEEGVLRVNCECPYFESAGVCKHLWAVVLAADGRGLLSAAASASSVSLDDYVPEDDWSESAEMPFPRSPRGKASAYVPSPPKPPQVPTWRRQLAGIAEPSYEPAPPRNPWPSKRQVLYVVDVAESLSAGCGVLWLASHDLKGDGSWTRPVNLSLRRGQIGDLPSPEDREILAALAGGVQNYGYGWSYSGLDNPIPVSCLVPDALAKLMLPLVIRTGRGYWRDKSKSDELVPLTWDGGGTWRFGIEIRRGRKGGWAVAGVLNRGEERMDLAVPILITQGGFVFTHDGVAPLAEDTAFQWVARLRKIGSIEAPDKDRDQLLTALLSLPGLPPPEVPEELRYQEVTVVPRPRLHIRADKSVTHASGRLQTELSYDYGGQVVQSVAPTPGLYDPVERRFLRRDAETEKAAEGLLHDLGVRFRPPTYWDREPAWDLAPSKLPRLVRALVEAGWHIEAEGKIFRRPGAFHLEVSSGVDWFELHGKVGYGETEAQLPALLEALRRGETVVRLDDGTYGVMPEEWLQRIGMLAGMGTPEGSGHIRFRRSQAGLLDALLATQPEARCDATFARLREELGLFQGIEGAAQPAGFAGRLRDYQREGVGWMEFLRRFSFGGCLADDMGVGKTAQVLALLETRRERRAAGEPMKPSLVVVPRSLVFNWKQEVERFTPQLRVLDYTGLGRDLGEPGAFDVVLTTYGTLRRDVLRLKDFEFDYVVLDEAQAVKNAGTEAAKAVRLLHCENRLALSGTPVENHLGELWSLFEFLNPGMLGKASVFKLAGAAGRNPDGETRRLLAHGLRPFILRRTKEQVARELPPKTEQTVYCEMEAVQRKLYDELRQHYRNALLKRIETDGLAKSKIQVLEALLRLRQAACHPGLIDPSRSSEGSAKLGVLLGQLREVLDEGHKALVFSQFTSLLRIVRDRLDSEGIVYEYLDGSTRDRQSAVQRFQEDGNCRLFLVSLKAGGLGLNLTAAEYVFLLDPWWNPAVEAQAVDRAHRIGQERQVFAYRLIARDTVEEKVLELQKSKRDLAAAIISADNSVIRDLRREDLELLLS